MHIAAPHNRSVSVPPSEHRTAAPRAAQTQLLKPKPLLTPTRSLSLMDLLPAHVDAPQPANEAWSAPGDNYDLPFLDLHYYSSSPPGAPDGSADATTARQGQALDLAQAYVHPTKALGLPPSLAQHIPMGSVAPPPRMLPTHHRVQSAVSRRTSCYARGTRTSESDQAGMACAEFVDWHEWMDGWIGLPVWAEGLDVSAV
ncbi:hypothetical protein A0H81_05257 [Grifola frondosa]|uniref:Uncharacterized protein n=1 Tax=Grifola frondosa TaxID=5627 RepID=A0A1C7MDJ4_GRIFR|nr:hypothetical protein A0H81_05257 [Grifola frondosa]